MCSNLKIDAQKSKVAETKRVVKERKDIFNSLETIFSKETDRKPPSESDGGSLVSKSPSKKGPSLWPSAAAVIINKPQHNILLCVELIKSIFG